MKPKPKHGGARQGAGRKMGSGKGRTAVSKSVTMPQPTWDRLDKARCELSRGKYIAKKI